MKYGKRRCFSGENVCAGFLVLTLATFRNVRHDETIFASSTLETHAFHVRFEKAADSVVVAGYTYHFDECSLHISTQCVYLKVKCNLMSKGRSTKPWQFTPQPTPHASGQIPCCALALPRRAAPLVHHAVRSRRRAAPRRSSNLCGATILATLVGPGIAGEPRVNI